jgi:hypothetical protein
MQDRQDFIGGVQVALIAPAVLFLGAVLIEKLGGIWHATPAAAEVIVTWYASRMWTLWVLLVALPVTVFGAGCAVLWRTHTENKRNLRLAGQDSAMRLLSSMTVLAGVVLLVVGLHMAAN